MTYYVLANPNAGSKRGKTVMSQLTEYFSKQSIDYKLFITTAAGDEQRMIEEILSALTADKDHILIIGGDGTLSLAVNALPSHVPFSYIPAGSGNDFARATGISREAPLAVFEKIVTAKPREIYVIHYESLHFKGIALNNIGIGLDAQIVASARSAKEVFGKVGLGQLSYLFTALHVLFSKKAFKIAVKAFNVSHPMKDFAVNTATTNVKTTHSQTYDKAFLLTLTKHPYFGGGIAIAPTASNLSALMTFVEVNKIPQRQFFGLLLKVIKGTHTTDSRVRMLSSDHFEMTVGSDQPMHIDGEIALLPAGETLKLTTEKRTIIG